VRGRGGKRERGKKRRGSPGLSSKFAARPHCPPGWRESRLGGKRRFRYGAQLQPVFFSRSRCRRPAHGKKRKKQGTFSCENWIRRAGRSRGEKRGKKTIALYFVNSRVTWILEPRLRSHPKGGAGRGKRGSVFEVDSVFFLSLHCAVSPSLVRGLWRRGEGERREREGRGGGGGKGKKKKKTRPAFCILSTLFHRRLAQTDCFMVGADGMTRENKRKGEAGKMRGREWRGKIRLLLILGSLYF